MDPTLLLKREEWDKICKVPREKDNYIFVYAVNRPIELLTYAKKLARKENLKVIYLSDFFGHDKKVKYISTVSPEEFIGYIKSAKYVLTNSFHGTVFSIIFHKQFAVELENESKFNYRAQNLLEKLGLSDHICKNNHLNLPCATQWDNVEKTLGEIRKKSIDYLEEIVEQQGANNEQK